MNAKIALDLFPSLCNNPLPPPYVLPLACCLLLRFDLSGKLRLQRVRHPLGDRVAHEHELGLRRDRERCGVHGERLRGFVVVHAQRRPLARKGGLQPCHPLLFRVRTGEGRIRVAYQRCRAAFHAMFVFVSLVGSRAADQSIDILLYCNIFHSIMYMVPATWYIISAYTYLPGNGGLLFVERADHGSLVLQNLSRWCYLTFLFMFCLFLAYDFTLSRLYRCRYCCCRHPSSPRRSLCKASVVQKVMGIVHAIANHMLSFVPCASFLLSWADSAVRYILAYAVCFIGVYGLSFNECASSCGVSHPLHDVPRLFSVTFSVADATGYHSRHPPPIFDW